MTVRGSASSLAAARRRVRCHPVGAYWRFVRKNIEFGVPERSGGLGGVLVAPATFAPFCVGRSRLSRSLVPFWGEPGSRLPEPGQMCPGCVFVQSRVVVAYDMRHVSLSQPERPTFGYRTGRLHALTTYLGRTHPSGRPGRCVCAADSSYLAVEGVTEQVRSGFVRVQRRG